MVKSNPDNINKVVELIDKKFNSEIDKTKSELTKIVKDFLENTLKEEWIYAEESHDVKATKDKKKLKREKKYNDKKLIF